MAGRRLTEPVSAGVLRVWVREDFGLDLASIDEVHHGADETAQLWHVVTADGQRYAVKLTGGGSPAALRVTAELAGRGVAGVAAPLSSTDGTLWTERAGRRLSVTPWVADRRALDGGMTAAHWSSLGALLAGVHATPVTDAPTHLLPRERHDPSGLLADVRTVDRGLRAVGAAPHATGADELTVAVADEWCAAASLVAALLDPVDELGRVLRGRERADVLCHADPHIGNLLLGDHGEVWLVDWDDAVLAPREVDLMFVLGGVLAFAPVTRTEQDAFFEGYGPVEPDPERLAYHLSVRALVDVADWAATAADPARGSAARSEALSIVRGLVSPTGLVTLAAAALRELGLLTARLRTTHGVSATAGRAAAKP